MDKSGALYRIIYEATEPVLGVVAWVVGAGCGAGRGNR